jgi:hypothetical protein
MPLRIYQYNEPTTNTHLNSTEAHLSMTIYLYPSNPSDMICMHMGIHSIYKLQTQFRDY